MKNIFSLPRICDALEGVEKLDTINSIEEGFVAYTEGKVVVPPVGEMIFGQSHGCGA